MRRPASLTGTEYHDCSTHTLALASTLADSSRAGSNGSAGNGYSLACSTMNASPMVSARWAIRRASSSAIPAAISWLSSSRQATFGTGTRWARRNRH